MNSDSFRQAENRLQGLATGHLTSLWERWERMGLDREALLTRIDVVVKEMERTMTGMVAEEDGYIGKVVNCIERHGIEMGKLAKELGVTVDHPDPELGLLMLEKELRHRVEKLRDMKAQRMKEVLTLKAEDEELCAGLCEDPFYISTTLIPTSSQMDDLKKHISQMKTLKNRRYAVFSETKLSVISLLEQLEAEPDTTFERNVVCESDEAFVLSASNLQALEDAHGRLKQKMEENQTKAQEMRTKIFRLMDKLEQSELEKDRVERELCGHTPTVLKELERILGELEVLKSEKMEQFIRATRVELAQYWDLCYYSQLQRDKFVHYFSNDFTEALLDVHEREVDSIRDYYEANLDLYKKVSKRQELWKKMLELEAKQKDPTHLLKAKGNVLLLEERDRKRVNRLLPKVEAELKNDMDRYYAEHGRPFLVGGVCYDDFIEHQIEEHARHVEEEKAAKSKMKKEQNFHETIYGSKPKTPMTASAMKRKASATPLNSSKRPRKADVTSRSNTLRSAGGKSPYGPRSSQKLAVANSSKYGLRAPTNAKRKILGDRNNDTFVAGPPQHSSTLSSVDSDNFFKDIPHSAATSTFQSTPECATPTRKSRISRLATPKSASKGVFKTPIGRALTPGNRAKSTGKKLTLRSGRPLPFLI